MQATKASNNCKRAANSQPCRITATLSTAASHAGRRPLQAHNDQQALLTHRSLVVVMWQPAVSSTIIFDKECSVDALHRDLDLHSHNASTSFLSEKELPVTVLFGKTVNADQRAASRAGSQPITALIRATTARNYST